MDIGQTFNAVDMHHLDRREWPSFEDFSRDEVKNWRDIDIGPFKLLETFYRTQKVYGGPSVVLKLEHKSGTILQVWTFPTLVNAMEKIGKPKYIWNHGLMKCEITGKYFNDFSFFL